ncbi:potassium transporter Trk [Bifidobacterium simiarum]|uniref:Potassium transporter Trk n=2 Tax=Bifidobacterium simiarum TaxID=2045441 RepID=A0A2M9HGV8_9BIFI|nr:potassium transporter TrkG [Bifidobacterium simiarum]MBT1165880.1 potassium transporter Trk [Bifidobacterium simiarum]PJM76011.1 potassium transporter Trk [Bifidobacterium simiarum]
MLILVTMLLSLPVAARSGEATSFHTAFFTAASALSTCGIAIVSTNAYWTMFGQVVILLAIQFGGLGVMTFASLLSMSITRRIRVSQKIRTANELGAEKLNEVRSVIAVVLICTFSVEIIAFILLLTPLMRQNPYNVGHALFEALFFAVTSYNNTGFTPDTAGLYIHDWGIGIPIMLSAFIGTLGFPVILNVFRCACKRKGPRSWSLHSKLTIVTTMCLVCLSLIWFCTMEWNNTELFPSDDLASKIRHALVAAVMPRSAGFDISWMPHVSEQTKLFMTLIMFIGGGSASTAGGIRVTTFAVLLIVCRGALVGRRDDSIFGKRLHTQTVIQAITITGICTGLVYVSSLALLCITNRSLTDVMFEVCSAFGLGGYTLGVADPNNPGTLYILAALMIIGRLGPMTVAYAISRPQQPQAFRYPSEHILVG